MVNKYLQSCTLDPSCRSTCGGQATGCVHLMLHLELASSRSTHRPNSNKWLQRPSLVRAPLPSGHHTLLFSEAATPAAPIGPVVVCGSFSILHFLFAACLPSDVGGSVGGTGVLVGECLRSHLLLSHSTRSECGQQSNICLID